MGSELAEVGWIVKKRLSLKGFIFGAMTFSIPTLLITTPSIAKLSITTFSKMALNIMNSA